MTAISALGLKDHTTVPIDIVEDEKCTQATYKNFKTLRMPDSIQAVKVDGKDYILTANEGDDKEYGDFEEKMKLKKVVKDGAAQLAVMTVTAEATAAAGLVGGVESSMRVTVGSAAV